MKTFADYLPTMTARDREIVEAYQSEVEQWHQDARRLPIEQMRATPPAKESVGVDGTCAGYGLPGANGMLSVVRVLVDVLQDEGEKAGIKRGDRVRVVKIEETK